jgi:hypothetical protein
LCKGVVFLSLINRLRILIFEATSIHLEVFSVGDRIPSAPQSTLSILHQDSC